MLRTIIHDCDPGLDDAAALLMALGVPDRLSVAAVTTVAGNVPLAATFRNARGLLALAGREDVPCHAGCPRALMVPPLTAEQVHGVDGIGGVALPQPTVTASGVHAVEALIGRCRSAGSDGVTLMVTGPMTNVAVALVMAPDILDHLREIVFMGGVVDGPGNITPDAEFNFAVDPHAASIVLSCGAPMVMMGLDVTRKVELTLARVAAIRDIGTPVSDRLSDMLAAYRDGGGSGSPRVLHDPCTVAYLLRPAMFTGQKAHVSVATDEGPARGRSVANWTSEGPVTVMTDIDTDAFYALLIDCLAGSEGSETER